MADAVRDGDIDLVALTAPMPFDTVASSDARFEMLAAAVAGRQQNPPRASGASPVIHGDGTRIAELRSTARALTLKLSRSDAPGFADWLEANAEDELLRLYDRWTSQRG